VRGLEAPEGELGAERPLHTLELLCELIPERFEPVWVSADPTNRRLADETHVKIGHGRVGALVGEHRCSKLDSRGRYHLR
jgi:hypothetical protein